MALRSGLAGLGLLAVLTACEPTPDEATPPAPTPPVIEPEAPDSATDLPGFVGRWAAAAELCPDEAWIITTIRLDTPAGGWCAWNPAEVEARPDGWRIPAVCEAEGQSGNQPLVIEGPREGPVSLSGGVFAPVTLVRCDEGRQAPTDGDPAAPQAEAVATDARIEREGIRDYDFRHFQEFHRAWRVDDQVIRIEERLADDAGELTGQRVFYLRPGERDPFFVRDPFAAYAFEDGRLTWWYDETGAVLGDIPPTDRAQRGTALLERARTLRRASDG